MSKTALVLVGHGSARHPESAAPILALADSLRALGRWDEVTAVFMKQEPKPAFALDLVNADTVIVIPVFAGKGYYTDTLIPREMGLTGELTLKGRRRVLYLPPAGGSPRIPGLMACRADGVARECGWDPQEIGLLLIAHGSSRPGGAGETPKAIFQALTEKKYFAETALVFLEQAPYATQWPALISAKQIVALPLLVAQGMHASQDIPPLFGLVSGETGPARVHGRMVRLASGLGAEPELVDIIAEMAGAALQDWGSAQP